MLATVTTSLKSLADQLFAPSALNTLAELLDDRFTLPGTSIRVGWDFVIGLVPIAGDLVSTLLSTYILVGAIWHGAAIGTLTRMVGNILVDFVIGLIPVVGDFLDARWMSNARNVRLLNADLARRVIPA